MCIRDRRDRTGKSARIAEKIRKKIGIDIDVKPETVTEENLAQVTPAPDNKKEEVSKVEVAPAAETKKEETPKAKANKEEAEKKKESSPEKK